MHKFIAIICLLIGALPTYAEDVSDYVSRTPAPRWTVSVSFDYTRFEPARDLPREYLGSERQIRVTAETTERYSHFATRLNTSEAVRDEGSISIPFDPTYERIELHQLEILRGEDRIDLLDLTHFQLFQNEEDIDRLIYNGTLQLYYALPDVRIGDVLEIAYTVKGRNPAFGPHFATGVGLGYTVPVRLKRTRYIFPENYPVHLKLYGDAPAPKITEGSGTVEYLWELRNMPAVALEKDRTADDTSLAHAELTSFASWQDVGRFFAPKYAPPNKTPEALEDIAADIAKMHESKSEQLRAALAYVQREIRYLGIELGEGGYHPRTPETVLARRFGDCKDMVVLLASLLAALDIEAQPVLVHTEKKGAVADRLPSLVGFNHVILRAFAGEKRYFLDPTKGEQLGDLEHLQQGDFGKGVVIGPESEGMIDVIAPTPRYFEELTDRFERIEGSDDVLYESTSAYFMREADSMNNWRLSKGLADIEASFLRYYADLYPGIEQTEPLSFELNEEEAQIIFRARYKIPNLWTRTEEDESIEGLYVFPGEVLADMPKFVGGARNRDFALPHPIATRQTFIIKLNDDWNLDTDRKFVSSAAFEYLEVKSFGNDALKQSFAYRSKEDRIKARDFERTMASLDEIRENAGIYLTYDTDFEESSFNFDEETITLVIFGYMFALFAASLLGAYLLRNKDKDWRNDGIYYPVGLFKFTIMTLGTLGIYWLFYAYKSWLWVRENEMDCNPFLRALFASFTNFTLFARMARHPAGGISWFRFAAFPTALILLISAMIDRYEMRAPEGSVPDWLSILSIAALLLYTLPAYHVLKLNTAHEDVIQKNSRFGWPSVLMLLGYLPLLALLPLAYLG